MTVSADRSAELGGVSDDTHPSVGRQSDAFEHLCGPSCGHDPLGSIALSTTLDLSQFEDGVEVRGAGDRPRPGASHECGAGCSHDAPMAGVTLAATYDLSTFEVVPDEAGVSVPGLSHETSSVTEVVQHHEDRNRFGRLGALRDVSSGSRLVGEDESAGKGSLPSQESGAVSHLNVGGGSFSAMGAVQTYGVENHENQSGLYAPLSLTGHEARGPKRAEAPSESRVQREEAKLPAVVNELRVLGRGSSSFELSQSTGGRRAALSADTIPPPFPSNSISRVGGEAGSPQQKSGQLMRGFVGWAADRTDEGKLAQSPSRRSEMLGESRSMSGASHAQKSRNRQGPHSAYNRGPSSTQEWSKRRSALSPTRSGPMEPKRSVGLDNSLSGSGRQRVLERSAMPQPKPMRRGHGSLKGGADLREVSDKIKQERRTSRHAESSLLSTGASSRLGSRGARGLGRDTSRAAELSSSKSMEARGRLRDRPAGIEQRLIGRGKHQYERGVRGRMPNDERGTPRYTRQRSGYEKIRKERARPVEGVSKEGRFKTREHVPHESRSRSRERTLDILERVQRVISKVSRPSRHLSSRMRLLQLDLASRIIELIDDDEYAGISELRSGRRMVYPIRKKRSTSAKALSNAEKRKARKARDKRASEVQQSSKKGIEISLQSTSASGKMSSRAVKVVSASAKGPSKTLDIFQGKCDDGEGCHDPSVSELESNVEKTFEKE